MGGLGGLFTCVKKEHTIWNLRLWRGAPYIYIYMITYVKIHVYLDGLTILDGLDGLTALLRYRTYAMCFTVHM